MKSRRRVVIGATVAASAATSTPAREAAKAKAALQPFLEVPTTLTGGTPLPEAPPTGKTVVYLACDNLAGSAASQAVERAAGSLGWTFKSIPFKLADPSTFISAMDGALAFKPAFVSFLGMPEAAWAGEIPKYKAAGVGIVPDGAGTFQPDETLLGYSSDKTYNAKLAEMLGNWLIQDSGANGDVLVMRFPEVPTSVVFTGAFKRFVSTNCSRCKVETVDVTNAQLTSGAAAAAAVAAVQTNPHVEYVFTPVASGANGLRSALDTIGRKDVKIGGHTGSYQNFVNIAAGTESVWVNKNRNASGYTTFDTALHGMAGKKYQYETDTYPPIFLVTKDNLPALGGPEAAKAAGDFDLPSNYVDLYTALWMGKSTSEQK